MDGNDVDVVVVVGCAGCTGGDDVSRDEAVLLLLSEVLLGRNRLSNDALDVKRLSLQLPNNPELSANARRQSKSSS